MKNTSQYSVKTSFQVGQIALNKHLNGKKNNLRPYQNINDNHYEKLKKAIEKYKVQYSAKFSKGVQKDREAAKENLFQNFMYGLAELTESYNDNQELRPEEQALAKKNENEQFDIAKQLAISIETCIFLIHNNNNKHQIKNNYRQKQQFIILNIDRFRELLANLKDDKNSELRFSILRGSITPDKLSKMSGRELANSEKQREWKKREEIVLKSKTLTDQSEIISKSHKGQEIIQIEQHEVLATIEEEVEEVQEKGKISNGFSDLNSGKNGIDSKLKLERNGNNKKNKENLELLNQLKSLINSKQKKRLIQRIENYLPYEISSKIIAKFKKK